MLLRSTSRDDSVLREKVEALSLIRGDFRNGACGVPLWGEWRSESVVDRPRSGGGDSGGAARAGNGGLIWAHREDALAVSRSRSFGRREAGFRSDGSEAESVRVLKRRSGIDDRQPSRAKPNVRVRALAVRTALDRVGGSPQRRRAAQCPQLHGLRLSHTSELRVAIVDRSTSTRCGTPLSKMDRQPSHCESVKSTKRDGFLFDKRWVALRDGMISRATRPRGSDVDRPMAPTPCSGSPAPAVSA